MAQPTKYSEHKNRGEIGSFGTLDNGGKGSGNWHHKGRPGVRGGSGKGTGGITNLDQATFALHKRGLAFAFVEHPEDMPTTAAKFMAMQKKNRELAKATRKHEETTQEKIAKFREEVRKRREKSLKNIPEKDRACYMETGYTESEYQKKFKRAWNE